MSVHTTHAKGLISLSTPQVQTITTLADTGMRFQPHLFAVLQDPYSMAIMGEVFDDNALSWERPIYTIITASGMTFCPYES